MKKYRVSWRNSGVRYSSIYYTDYHAEQFARALRLSGCTDVQVSKEIAQ